MDKQYSFRRFVIICIFISLCMQLFAEAPELRNVMPNSWQKLTRLTAEEEVQFWSANEVVIAEIKKEINRINTRSGENLHELEEIFMVYRQDAGTETFYRVLCLPDANHDLLSPAARFWQFLVYRNRLLTDGEYNFLHVTQSVYYSQFISIDIIMDGNTAKGILKTELTVLRDNRNDTKWSPMAYYRGQLRSWSIPVSYYFLMEDLIKNIDSGTGTYLTENCPRIEINASECLVDQNIPLRYCVQSAFDGDPATSYVENTENDLMNIWIYVSWDRFKSCAIINGYAQNIILYKKNNRIKSLWLNDSLTILSDNTLSYQIMDIAHQCLSVSSIYKGNEYNDTCLAEYNVYIDGIGWLFGGINE